MDFYSDPVIVVKILEGGTGFSTVAGDFTGQFDDVRVYTRALSSTEVTSLFNYR